MRNFEEILKEIPEAIRKETENVIDNNKVFCPNKNVNKVIEELSGGNDDFSINELYQVLDSVQEVVLSVLKEKGVNQKFEEALKDDFLYTDNTLTSQDILFLWEKLDIPLPDIVKLINDGELQIFDTPQKMFFSLLSFNFKGNPLFNTEDLYDFKISRIHKDEIEEDDSIGSLIVEELYRRGHIIYLQGSKIAYTQYIQN